MESGTPDGYNVYHFYIRQKDYLMKYAFVDLDETLIHTDTTDISAEFPESDSAILTFGESEKYYALYRKGAREFLTELRKNCDRVFMLTIAVQDYAEAMNETFNLGFDKSEIYSRYDLRRSVFDYPSKKKPDLIPGAVFLFDNLSYHDNREKTMYLEPYGKLSYIKVPAFYGYEEFSPELIAQYIDKITKTKV